MFLFKQLLKSTVTKDKVIPDATPNEIRFRHERRKKVAHRREERGKMRKNGEKMFSYARARANTRIKAEKKSLIEADSCRERIIRRREEGGGEVGRKDNPPRDDFSSSPSSRPGQN